MKCPGSGSKSRTRLLACFITLVSQGQQAWTYSRTLEKNLVHFLHDIISHHEPYSGLPPAIVHVEVNTYRKALWVIVKTAQAQEFNYRDLFFAANQKL